MRIEDIAKKHEKETRLSEEDASKLGIDKDQIEEYALRMAGCYRNPDSSGNEYESSWVSGESISINERQYNTTIYFDYTNETVQAIYIHGLGIYFFESPVQEVQAELNELSESERERDNSKTQV